MLGQIWDFVTDLFSRQVSGEQMQAQLARLHEQSPVTPSKVARHRCNPTVRSKMRPQDRAGLPCCSAMSFERFVAKTPFDVMARSMLDKALVPEALDALFKDQARFALPARVGHPCASST